MSAEKRAPEKTPKKPAGYFDGAATPLKIVTSGPSHASSTARQQAAECVPPKGSS